MTVFVTGGTGFLGKYVIAAALGSGLEVTAAVRSESSRSKLIDWLETAKGLTKTEINSLSTVKVDLRSPDQVASGLDGVDIVIHLAATKAGDFYTQFAGTVNGTENLLDQMQRGGVEKLVGVSTFSVYDYPNLGDNSLLDENSATVADPQKRDEYTQTKLIQEKLYRDFGNQLSSNVANDAFNETIILRPGMIYGPDNLWHALLGSSLGPRFLKIGSKATLPLIYVENCAEAIVAATTILLSDPATIDGEIINLVDDNLPTQKQYAELVSARIETPKTVQMPWPAMKTIASSIELVNQTFLKGRMKLPGIVVPDKLEARFKPLRFTNAKAKTLLNWSPTVDLATAIERSAAAEQAAEQSSKS